MCRKAWRFESSPRHQNLMGNKFRYKLELMPVKTLIATAIAVLFVPLSVFAQTTSSLQKAQDDYNFQAGKYKDAHHSYLDARSTYLTFQTATAKDDAFTKTKAYLIQVDQLYESFL